jgi:chitinase
VTRLAAIVLLLLAVGGSVGASGADFTASSYSTASITTAADFNTVVVSLTNPGSPLTGTVALNATATSDRGMASVKIQYAPTGTSDWVDICTDNSSPYSCSLNTTTLADQNYDFQAIATDTAGYSKTATVTNRTIDNYTLAVTLNDPGAMSGTVNLTAIASGASPSLQGVKIQQRAAGATTWNDVCAFQATSPRTCAFDTTAFADGNRELRAVATDTGGHTAQTAAITRMIDNSPPTATPTIPTSGSGTVTMSATASDSGSGIAYVAWEAYYMGAWWEFCRDTTTPYTCSGDSTTVPDGVYPTRIVVANNAGVKTTSTPTSITIDNTPPAGSDVTTFNGGGTAGRIQTSDWIRLTWSEPIAPASVVSGWDGSSRSITVRIADVGSNDQMDFYDGDDATRLNLVSTAADLKLGGDYVSSLVKYQATMVQSGNSITITFGNLISGSRNTTVAGTITWQPSALATDLVGHPSSTALVTESGALDLDF